MTQRGLFLRFWVALILAIVVGLIALAVLMKLGRLGDPAQGLARYVLMAIPLVLLVIVALFAAITFGSIVWNALYWAATIAPSLFTSKPLELADFGRSPKTDDAGHSGEEHLRNPGTLREFLALKDDPEFRIGIILAGGGAKGVYQAGAMQAIWDFLEKESAHKYVRMVAATSIGSWNAMFWLTSQVSAPGAERGPLYQWWTSARTSTVVNPTVYVPLRNYLAGTLVWREQFKKRFIQKPEPLPFFYFTRTNVQHASLEYSTNREPSPTSAGQLPNYRERPNSDRSCNQSVGIDQIESAVFASMDIPPAFKRLRDRDGNEYEDGGVIDNLPIQFATWCEGCNLLFVLPLNATFNARPNGYSILARMARVLDVRQGALERDSLKDISLYNQLIEATREGGRPSKVHKYATTTFCICPAPRLDVNTFGFWSLKRHAKECYDLMYEATRSELAKFDFSIGNTDVRMAQVHSDGSVRYEDFTLESEPARPEAPVTGDAARR